MSFKVTVRNGGRADEYVCDTPLMGHEVLSMAGLPDKGTVMAWRVNHYMRPLGWFIDDDSDVEFVDTSSYEGTEIYRNTLTFILALACRRALKSDISVKYSMSDSYCCAPETGPAGPEEAAAVREEMKRIVDAAMPIQMATLPLDKARRIFERQGSPARSRLLRWTGTDPVTLSRCGGVYAYFGSPLAANTSQVSSFDLDSSSGGFLLRFPPVGTGSSGKVVKHEINSALMNVFDEYSSWLKLLGLTTMDSLHDIVAGGKAKELLLVSEAFHNMTLANLASSIASRGSVRLICISGPSSSGKTTSSKRLSIQLRVLGMNPVPIELDNYYVDREKTPLGEDGAYDFEALEALDVERVNRDLVSLMEGRETRMPVYDFIAGKSKEGPTLQLKPNDVLLIEGIHGFNDALTGGVPREAQFRVFTAPFTGVNLDAYNRIGTTDTRLLRRMVRDYRRRGYSPERTIALWPSVIRGSHKHIFPYEQHADAMFNTALAYEIPVLKGYAEQLLRSVPEGAPEFGEASRLLALLSFSPVIPSENIPNNSIIREFIGGSCFYD